MKLLVLIWLACGMVSGAIGLRKGEGPLGFLTGLLFGPYGICIALFTRATCRPCPGCGRRINRKLPFCPHCNQDLH